MGKIYLITNLINNKKYVGLTTRNINIRWREHCRASTLLIDKAIIEYGKENFSITELEECPDYDLDDREQYWISYYDSYKNGYNCTAGGRRETMVLNSEKKDWVAQLWNQGYNQKSIVQITKLNVETVHNYLLKSGVTAEDINLRYREAVGASKSKPIIQYDANGTFIKEWPSQAALVRTGAICRSTLLRCLKQEGKIFQGYQYKYKGENK